MIRILILIQTYWFSVAAQAQSPELIEKLNTCYRIAEEAPKRCDHALHLAGTTPLSASTHAAGGVNNSANSAILAFEEHRSRLYNVADVCSNSWEICKQHCADEIENIPRSPENQQLVQYMNTAWQNCDGHLTSRAQLIKAELANTDANIAQARVSGFNSNGYPSTSSGGGPERIVKVGASDNRQFEIMMPGGGSKRVSGQHLNLELGYSGSGAVVRPLGGWGN